MVWPWRGARGEMSASDTICGGSCVSEKLLLLLLFFPSSCGARAGVRSSFGNMVGLTTRES